VTCCVHAQASDAGDGVGIQRTASTSSSAPATAATTHSAKSTSKRRLSLIDTGTSAAAAAATAATAAAASSSSSGVPDIYMWSHCKKCGRMASPLVQMSEDTWKFSFGKFLEVSYYNSSARGRYVAQYAIYTRVSNELTFCTTAIMTTTAYSSWYWCAIEVVCAIDNAAITTAVHLVDAKLFRCCSAHRHR
jgi:hypothetical protein